MKPLLTNGRCIACSEENPTPFVLGPKCEALARMWCKRDGIPIRELPVLVVHDEPDD